MANVIDLRGRQLVPAPAAVLADPSGRRARVLARGGRGVAGVFLLWLVGLGLALAVGPEPPALTTPPATRPLSASDAAPARAFGATASDRAGGVGAGSI